jgi:hypothetical protein
MEIMYRNIPSSLLLLSRAFKIPTTKKAPKMDAKEATVEGLKTTFNMLPDETIEDVEMESFKSMASLEKRLEYLQRVEQEIEDENELVKEEDREELAAAREALEVRSVYVPSYEHLNCERE